MTRPAGSVGGGGEDRQVLQGRVQGWRHDRHECEPEPQKKEPTGISKTDTEELEGLINKQKEEQKKAGNMDVRLSESAGTQKQRSEANRIL